MPRNLNELTSSQLDGLPKDKTVFFFPVGPIEDHGNHLPMGLDLEEAERLCHLAAGKLESEKPGWVGVVFPKIPLGIQSDTTRTAITVRSHVLRDFLLDSCKGLVKRGFLHFVCFSGHPGPKQLTAIEEAGTLLKKAYRLRRLAIWKATRHRNISLVSASSALVDPGSVRHAPLWPDPPEHGGCRDTSIALAISPEKVDPGYQGLPPIRQTGAGWIRFFRRVRGKLSGYWGDPSRATPAAGQAHFDEAIDTVYPKLLAVWNGADATKVFRSWYGIFPPNKSFFKAWILSLLLFSVLCLIWLTQFSVGNLE